jgi:hypothetical protein
LGGDRNGRFFKRSYRAFEPVSARNTASGIYENGFFHRTACYSRKHHANGRPLKDVYNLRPPFRTPEHDSRGAIRSLQIPVGKVVQGSRNYRPAIEKNGGA